MRRRKGAYRYMNCTMREGAWFGSGWAPSKKKLCTQFTTDSNNFINFILLLNPLKIFFNKHLALIID